MIPSTLSTYSRSIETYSTNYENGEKIEESKKQEVKVEPVNESEKEIELIIMKKKMREK